MEQDLGWPKQTHRGLSLDFIRHWVEGKKGRKKTTLRVERPKQRRREGRGKACFP